ncbi:hypothetical protein BDK63_001826 [Halomonas campaniensis]|uniref:Protein kinase domain-containing protein n=1 Tax=Halomonas campaniensis TaxID=213554 RepID=A0A7W5PBH7_9GAMM|nr:hypothetical protein [Halomonas campaniensis]MBB3330951.1 hypothetical protein [Halomonas campaniensis]
MKIKRAIRRRISIALGRPQTQRRFIDSALGVSGFLEVLKAEDIDYAVLRWFEELPYVAPGEDIDILVADEDVERLTFYTKFIGKKNDTPCDIYSVSGLPGTSSRNMPYYPVPVARKILKNAIWVNGTVRAPSCNDHFLSMCYHAVYHKGYASAIPSEDVDRNRNVVVSCDHDYMGKIKSLYESSNLKLTGFSITLEALDRLLGEAGWKPAYDTLQKMSVKNQWIHDALLSNLVDIEEPLRGLTIFLVREEGMSYLETIKETLFEEGFDHVLEGSIPADNVSLVASGIRGGNWGRGPWPKSGGLPGYYFVVYDAKPITPSAAAEKEHPGLVNERISMAKIKIRDFYNHQVCPQERCNIIHSADNAAQALDYLKLIDPSNVDFVQEVAKNKHATFATHFNVIKDLSNHARRAKVELIEYNGKKAICKTFKEGREEFLNREVNAREVGAGLDEVSEMLEVGDNYIVIDFYDRSIDDISCVRPLFHSNAYLPMWAIEKMKNIILYYRERGYECVDFSPKNILFDSRMGLKVIDFEFLQKGDAPSDSLVGNFAWYSAPDSFQGDLPKLKDNSSLYRRRWFRYTGLPLFFCVHNFPKSVLHLVRGVTFVCFSVNNARRKAVSLPQKRHYII